MLDEKDLQAIAQLMTQQKQDIFEVMDQKLAQQKREILGETNNLMDQKLARQKQEILGEANNLMDQKLARQKQEILSETAHQMKTLIDLEVTPKFNLLAEELQNVNDRLDRLTTPEEFEIMDSRMDTLELVVKKHSREIAELKKAQ